MARKRNRKRPRGATQADGRDPAAATSGRRRAWVLGVATLSLAGVAGGAWWLRGRADPPPAAAPTALAAFAPPEAHASEDVRREDFIGSDACAACHATQYDAWSGSTHGTAGGAPSRATVIAPFTGAPIRFADAVVTPRVRAGSWEFVVRQDGHEDVVFPVEGVIGRAHMIGGGTQGFVSRMDDGTVRFLPFDWSRDESAWFCNTGTRLDEGWVPIVETMRLADCGDWPPIRPLGTLAEFSACHECHGSQIEARLDPARAGYVTEYRSLDVNCESCHGPARDHVERAREGRLEPESGGLGLTSLVGLDKDASLEVCFRCHAVKDVLAPGYLPGESLQRHYALKFPSLGDSPYQADGRVRTFAYQANHLASACYLQGPMDCVSCHEPHGQGYWDIDKRPLASPFDDGQCTSCHPSKSIDPEAHTFHAPESDGARCVSCHMPYLQHPELGSRVRFARSDHTIPVPRPAFDAGLGVVGACAGCHDDRPVAELERAAADWWGELRPHRPLVAALLRARVSPGSVPVRDLLRPDEQDPLTQFQALAHLLGEVWAPDTPVEEPGVERLLELAGDDDLDVRSIALAALHWTRGDVPEVREELVSALGSDEDADLVQSRWALALGFLGDENRAAGRMARAERAYRKALEIAPGDPPTLTALGVLQSAQGDYASAVRTLRRSVQGDPSRPMTYVNLGIALAALGDAGGAADAYGEALALNRHQPLAHFNLGNLHFRAGDPARAIESYERAVAADPGLGRAHYYLALALVETGRAPEATPHARRAVEFEPDNDDARALLQRLEAAAAGN